MSKHFLSFCQDLIRLKSLSGQEGAVAERIIKEMKALNYDAVTVDAWGSVVGTIYGESDQSLMFEGHMDTVDVTNPEKWSVNPFGAVVKDNRLYGRGTADMKGALAAMVYGAGERVRSRPPHTLHVATVVFEEVFEGVALGRVLDSFNPDAVILGEPGSLDICIGQKGRAEIRLETFGKNAHSALPESGINAIESMRKLLDSIDSIPIKNNQSLGKGVRVMTDIHSSPYPGSSVIPDHCQVTVDLRLLQDEQRDEVLQKYEEVINRLKESEVDFDGRVGYACDEEQTYTQQSIGSERFYPGWIMAEDALLVSYAKRACKRCGREPRLSTYSFCTDGSESAGKRGIPTIGIGPASSSMAHQIDENISIADLEAARILYRELAWSDYSDFVR